MPTYVYRRADGTTFEAFQRISDDALTEDPETGQPVTRVISGGAGLQFKGSGFYLTDYVHKDSKSDKADRKAQDTGKAAEAPKKAEVPKKAEAKKADPKPAPAARKD